MLANAFVSLRRYFRKLLQPRAFHNFHHATLIFAPILNVKPGGFGVCRRIRVWIGKQALNRREDCTDVINGRPLILQDIEANGSVSLDVGMKHFAYKADDGRLVRVLVSKVNGEVKRSTFPCSVFRAKNDRAPLHDVVTKGCTGAAFRRIVLDLFEVPDQSAPCQSCHDRPGK